MVDSEESEKPKSEAGPLDKWLKPYIVISITVVWTISMIADALSSVYTVHFGIHGLMMTAAASVLGVQIMGKKES